jgi:hypothetical protein
MNCEKDVQYGEPGEALDEVDLEDLASHLEDYLNEVEALVSRKEAGEVD